MTLAPLLATTPLIQVHALLATGAIVLGAVQLAAPKGTIAHRTLGWTWIAMVAAMLIIAFLNHDIRLWDALGPGVCSQNGVYGSHAANCASIHLISLYFLLALPFGALHAHWHDVKGHRNVMLWLFLGLLLVGTVLTAVPHRVMHEVVFGS